LGGGVDEIVREMGWEEGWWGRNGWVGGWVGVAWDGTSQNGTHVARQSTVPGYGHKGRKTLGGETRMMDSDHGEQAEWKVGCRTSGNKDCCTK